MEIGGFLDRFKNIRPPNEFKRLAVKQALSDILGLEVSIEQVRVKGTVVYLDIPHADKAQVFMAKDEIVSFLKRNKENVHIEDVR